MADNPVGCDIISSISEFELHMKNIQDGSQEINEELISQYHEIMNLSKHKYGPIHELFNPYGYVNVLVTLAEDHPDFLRRMDTNYYFIAYLKVSVLYSTEWMYGKDIIDENDTIDGEKIKKYLAVAKYVKDTTVKSSNFYNNFISKQ